MTRITGTYERVTIVGEEVAAFIPSPLPPVDPALRLEGTTAARLDRAESALVRLELAAEMVPSAEWFIYAFMRKEAVISSQIEGTQATLVDLLAFDAKAEALSGPEADVVEVANYLEALDYARAQLRKPDGLPLSIRLLNESHRLLMRGVRGRDKQPGEIRRSQNWIGGTRPGNAAFVPPPPHLLAGLLRGFEQFIHADGDLPPLVRIGLLHAQFETIHPYLDGNGRIGRPPDRAPSGAIRLAVGAAPLRQPVFQTAPQRVLSAAGRCENGRRLGRLERVLSRGVSRRLRIRLWTPRGTCSHWSRATGNVCSPTLAARSPHSACSSCCRRSQS